MAGVKQPSDKSHFILPDLGEGVHEAELIKWRVKPGERVEEHQTLAEMETDKALVEVPSPWTGTVRDLGGHKEGDIVNVGEILVNFDVKGASAAEVKSSPAAAAAPKAKAEPAAAAAAPSGGGGGGGGEREDAGTVVGSVGGSLSIPARFARRQGDANGPSVESGGKALATPAVRRIAREAGIDINRIPGTGRGGRITASDVQDFIKRGTAAKPPAPAPGFAAPGFAAPRAVPVEPVPVSPDGTSEVIPFRGVRRKIAQSLDRSVRTAVHFTVVDDADVTDLDRKRREYSRILGAKLSLLPFVMAAVCRALRRHPALNAVVDDAAEEIHRKGVINVGVAVDTEHGLMVPVIEQADRLSIVQMSGAVADLARACRDRSVPREKLIGGTFTISNVGSYGGRYASPIINYPEVAILAAGRAREQVMTRGGMFYAGLSLPLSLSCDHRVVDGAEGARFLNTLVKMLERPEEMLT